MHSDWLIDDVQKKLCWCVCVQCSSASQPSTKTSVKSPPRQTTQVAGPATHTSQTTHRAAGPAANASQRLVEQMNRQMSDIAGMTERMEKQFDNTRLVSLLLIYYFFTTVRKRKYIKIHHFLWKQTEWLSPSVHVRMNCMLAVELSKHQHVFQEKH